MLFRRITGLILGLSVIISTLTAYSTDIEWTKVYVPNAYLLHSMAISSDASIIYVSDDEGGLNKSTDNGNTWVKLNPPITPAGDNLQVVCSSDGSIVFMVSSGTSQLLKSSDYGATWSIIEVDITNIAISDNGNIVYRTLGSGLFKSSDGGLNWTSLNPPQVAGDGFISCSADGSTVARPDGFRVNISNDSGNTWSTKKVHIYGTQRVSVSPNSNVIGCTVANGMLFSSDSFESYSPSYFYSSDVYFNPGYLSLSYDGSVILLLDGFGGITISTDSSNTWEHYFIEGFYSASNTGSYSCDYTCRTTYSGNKVFLCGASGGYSNSEGILLIGEIQPSIYTVTFVDGSDGIITGNKAQTVNEGMNSTSVSAVPSAGYNFVNWSGDYSGKINPLKILNVADNMTIYANFDHNTATLTVNKNGNGSAESSVSNPVNTVTEIPITANADENNHFVKWTVTSGLATIANVNSPETTVTLNGGHGSSAIITADFATGKLPAPVNITGLKQTYTGKPCPITVTTVPTGLKVNITYAGSADVPIIPGSYAVIATVAHDNYAGVKKGTLVIAKASQTITFPTLPTNLIYGDADYPVTITASSGLPVTYTSSNPKVITISPDGILHIVGAGTATITAKQPGNANWKAAPVVSKVVKIGKKSQTIDFPAFTSHVVGEANFSPGATTNSNLIITYTSSNRSVATIVKGKIHIVGKGSTVITAKQAGNTNWIAAPLIKQTLTVENGNL